MTEKPPKPLKEDLKWLMAAAVFLTLMFSAFHFTLGQGGASVVVQGCAPGQPPGGCWQQAPQGGESLQSVARFIFGAYALPFEVLSLVLLVALVGAVYLARLERPGEEGGEVE